MKTVLAAHRDAHQAMPKQVFGEVIDMLGDLDTAIEPNGATHIRKAILVRLEDLGWDMRVRISPELRVYVPAMKNRVVVCPQFGNISRAYADLVKCQHLYQMDACDGAIMVSPTKEAASRMATNLATSDRLAKELAVFRAMFNVPVHIVGVTD